MHRFARYFLYIGIFLSFFCAVSVTRASNWYGDSDLWQYRKQITVDSAMVVGGDQLNFPVLFSTTSPIFRSAANGGDVSKEEGSDILFTDSDGTTLLPFEIEKYDPVTGNVVAWIKIPTLSSLTNTTFYLYYSNAAAVASLANRAGVWDDNFILVNHLSEATGTRSDSTAHGFDALQSISPVASENGVIGDAALFSGNTNEVLATDWNTSLDPRTSDWTMEVWIGPSSTPGDIIAQDNNYRLRITPNYKIWANFFSQQDDIFYPTDVEADADYLYITDSRDRLIKVRRDTLQFVSELVDGVVTSTSQFNTHAAITGDSDYLYYTDYSNGRVVKRRKTDFGLVGVITFAATATDTLSLPSGIAVDDTFIYVSDTGKNRLLQFNKTDLSFVTATGTSGSGNNNFNTPYGLAADDDYLYVADRGNNRIKKLLKTDLSFVTATGTSGSGNNNFSNPSDIVQDATYLYIADYSNNRIVKRLKSDFSFVSLVGSVSTDGAANGRFNQPRGLAIYDGNLYLADKGNSRITIQSAANLSRLGVLGGPNTNDVDSVSIPRGLTTDDLFLYLVDYDNSRIVKRYKSDLSLVATVGSVGSGNNNFNRPQGITTDGTYLYIADTSNNRLVRRLNSDLSFVSATGTFGSGNNNFNTPRAVAVDDAYVYIADTSNNRLVKRDKNTLGFVSATGTSGSGNNNFNNPRGIAVDDAYVYISDTLNNRIVKRDKNTLAFVTSSAGFSQPQNIAIMGDYLYIADEINRRLVLRYNKDNMEYIDQIGITGFAGTTNDKLFLPQGVAVDSSSIYIADEGNMRITKYATNDHSFEDLVDADFISVYSSSSISTSSPTHVVLSFHSATSSVMYLNGATDTSSVFSGKYNNFISSSTLRLGGYANPFTGQLDEVRISNVARSGGWVATSYLNQSNPSVYVSSASTEYAPAIVPSLTVIPDFLGIKASWTTEGNPLTAEYFAENITASTTSGWIPGTSWMSGATLKCQDYQIRLKARNGAHEETAWSSIVTVHTICPVLGGMYPIALNSPSEPVLPAEEKLSPPAEIAQPKLPPVSVPVPVITAPTTPPITPASTENKVITVPVESKNETTNEPSVDSQKILFTELLRKAISQPPQKNLIIGEWSDEVKSLQYFLKNQGTKIYPEGFVTGYYGQTTLRAVQRLQKKYKLPQVGKVGPATRELIRRLLE